MIEGQGLFQLAQRSAAYSWLASNKTALHAQTGDPLAANPFERTDKLDFRSAVVTISSTTALRAFVQSAWDKMKADEHLITDENLKRLEKASKSDNKEIAAERLRQAKAKLRSLRLQAQMAAASGDPKALRRIAEQAAQAAREVASAARGMADGIVASATGADSASSAGTAATATGAPAAEGSSAQAGPQGVPAGETQEPAQKDRGSTNALPTTTDLLGSGREGLRKLGDEARSAIAQARGIIALAASAARSRRNHRPDPGEDQAYGALQRAVTDAEHDLDSGLNAARLSLDAGAESGTQNGPLGIDQTIAALTGTTLVVQASTVVTVTADIVV